MTWKFLKPKFYNLIFHTGVHKYDLCKDPVETYTSIKLEKKKKKKKKKKIAKFLSSN